MTATVTPAQDLANRWAPSAIQIATAQKMLADFDTNEVVVMVPIGLRNKAWGIWTTDVVVDPIEGVYVLAYSSRTPVAGAVDWGMARETVETIAEANSENGTGSYAIIRRNGTWAVWEV